MKIETLLVNGRLLTMDRTRPQVEAVAVTGGRIAAAGATAELMARRDRDTVVIDLGGRFGLPGFVDPHHHFGMTALAPVEADCRTPPLRSIPEMMERIHALASANPPGAWLRGHGYDEEALRERRHPTRAELDEASPAHPVVLVHWSVHRCVANSMALALLGIDAAAPDPPGGWIVRGPDGLPAGPLYETATNGAQSRSIAAYAERFALHAPDLLGENGRRILAAGITTVGDAYVSPPLRRLYEAAAAAGRLPLSVVGYCGSGNGLFHAPHECTAPPPSPEGKHQVVANIPASVPDPGSAPVRSDETGVKFSLAGIKLFTDGGGNTTATSLHPAPPGGNRRRLFYNQDELDGLVAAAHGQGLQVAIHAAGDMAVEMALTALEQARAAHPRIEPRFRIEHGVLLSDTLIRRLAAVGATLVVQPVAVYYHAEKTAAAPLAPGLRQSPLRDLLDAGVPVAFSSDAPCYPLDPLLHVWAAVTRTTRGGGIHEPEQRVSVDEALRLATAGGAHAVGRDGEAGVLTPGAEADLVLLSADPRAVPADELRRIRVEAVYRAGVAVYDRNRDGAVPVPGRLPD